MQCQTFYRLLESLGVVYPLEVMTDEFAYSCAHTLTFKAPLYLWWAARGKDQVMMVGRPVNPGKPYRGMSSALIGWPQVWAIPSLRSPAKFSEIHQISDASHDSLVVGVAMAKEKSVTISHETNLLEEIHRACTGRYCRWWLQIGDVLVLRCSVINTTCRMLQSSIVKWMNSRRPCYA